MPTFVIVIIIVVAVIAALPVLLLLPRRAAMKMKAPFFGLNFAHRGLHDKSAGIPENSLAAFARAAENGYGMELDVQLSRDGKVVVFHDDTLDRICGVKKRVDELDYSELSSLSLSGTNERIPLFSEVLKTVDCRTPIIVELKNGRSNKELCEKTLGFLREYKGLTCIESFNPFIVAWFRFHAPKVFRGQLSQPPECYRREGYSRFTAFALGDLLFNIVARPHFIAYKIGKKPLLVRFSEAMGAVRIGWTGRDAEAKYESDFDSVIFEQYMPEPKYK